MKTYICHKEVKAAKIIAIHQQISTGEIPIQLDSDAVGVRVTPEWLNRHPECEVGGYLVQYEDGYLSWSPAEAFEKGYTEVAEEF